MAHGLINCEVEQCWTLLGRRLGRLWLARRVGWTSGAPSEVEFDAGWVLEREEQRGDVIGMLHTHPGSPAVPSRRDVLTMRAWCSAFGKPLLCAIDGSDGLRAYRFDDDESTGKEVRIASWPCVVALG